MSPGEYQCGPDLNQWDFYHHAGVQIRFYRQQPAHLARVPFEHDGPPRPVAWLLRLIERILPI